VIAAEHARAPFTSSALMTAVEMLDGHPLLDVTERTQVPLLAIINAMDDDAITAEIEARLDEGYGTLKVKVGFDAGADAKRVHFIQDTVSGRALIRLDGNQGYGVEDAKKFAQALKPDGIELFEQPCPAGDWDAAVAVAEVARVPMMLDESIYGPDDIKRAAELGAARYVKLKLMKAGGLDALAQGLKQIRDLGMTPVLGNGVASDPGCWMEACAARHHIDNAGEMNGFLKPETGLFALPLAVEGGAMVLEPGVPELRSAGDLSALAAETADQGAHIGVGDVGDGVLGAAAVDPLHVLGDALPAGVLLELQGVDGAHVVYPLGPGVVVHRGIGDAVDHDRLGGETLEGLGREVGGLE